MASTDSMSIEDKQFLASCEELLKDRYTENDEEFMKVFKAEPSHPPILESWRVSQNRGRHNDRRFNRRNQPYPRDHEGHSRGGHAQGPRSRGYDDRRHGHSSHYPQY